MPEYRFAGSQTNTTTAQRRHQAATAIKNPASIKKSIDQKKEDRLFNGFNNRNGGPTAGSSDAARSTNRTRATPSTATA